MNKVGSLWEVSVKDAPCLKQTKVTEKHAPELVKKTPENY